MAQIVGINFSTRNRPEILEICLKQVRKWQQSQKYRYVVSVVNDLGDAIWDAKYNSLIEKFPDVIWCTSGERLGIARTKNRGISLLKEHNCDHFFLFDDDTFPVKHGWDDLYIEACSRNNIHHLMHLIPLPVGFHVQRKENGICEYTQCSGVLLYFTKHAINTVGGYRKSFHIYGHEHTELSIRCNHAGLQPRWGPYISPESSREYIYSIDLDLNNWGVNPHDIALTDEMKRPSIQGEDIQSYISYNAQFFAKNESVFEEI
jgi:glycosyl transferase family 7 (putative galactosyltransferase)